MADKDFRQRLAFCAACAACLSGFALWAVIGHMAAYLALILALVALAAAWPVRVLGTLAKAPWVAAFLVGFVLIAAAFLLQPGGASIVFIGDFLPFALAPLLAAALAPLARHLTMPRLGLLCLLATFLAAAVGLIGMAQGQVRSTAPDFSPIHFADLAVVLGFMGLAGTLVPGGGRHWPLYLGPALALVATVAAQTRGALPVALGLALLYGIVWAQGSALPRLAKLLLPLALCAFVILGLGLAYGLGFTRPLEAFTPILALLKGEMPADTSALYRVEMYRAGLLAFLDAPLIGHGWHQQIGAAMPYLTEIGREGYALERWGYIHNDALSLAVAAGIFGLAAYCLALAAPLLALLGAAPGPERKARLYFALCLSLGLFLSGATDVLFMVEVPKLLLVLGAAILYWCGAQTVDETGP